MRASISGERETQLTVGFVVPSPSPRHPSLPPPVLRRLVALRRLAVLLAGGDRSRVLGGGKREEAILEAVELEQGMGAGFFCGDLWCGFMDDANEPEKKLEDAAKNLKIDPPMKTNRVDLSGPKDASIYDATSCISSADATSSTKDSELGQESSMSEQWMCYFGYSYPGYNGLVGEWDTWSYATGTDGMESQPFAIQANNGSVECHFPEFQAGYTPYSPFVPGAMITADSQYLSQQPYHPSRLSPQSLVSPGIFPQMIAYGPELFPAFSWDPSVLFLDGLQGSTYCADPVHKHSKSSIFSQSRGAANSKAFQTSKIAPEVNGSSPMTSQTQTASKTQKLRNKAGTTLLSKAYTPINKFHLSNQGKGGFLYTNNAASAKGSSESWDVNEKLRVGNKITGFGDSDLLSKQNCGLRTSGTKSSYGSEVEPVWSPNGEKNDNKSDLIATVSKDQSNHVDFQTEYEHALFYVIKSYSEDDIHKSIKYNVWTSTPNGNKRLDNAFQAAQGKTFEKSSKCPVFLFFSVNASGQFCGLAEMTGRVDFSSNMNFWQQDKWDGFFPVKWHIIKDIPNSQFRHIILDNNDNKPVTNSRDTQEVKFPQGIEMLNILKSHSSKTSILDDFDFYESRQRAMQEKRNKLHVPNMLHSVTKNSELSQAPKASDSKPKVSDSLSPELYSENWNDRVQTLPSAME